jgi:hypothetical protein
MIRLHVPVELSIDLKARVSAKLDARKKLGHSPSLSMPGSLPRRPVTKKCRSLNPK